MNKDKTHGMGHVHSIMDICVDGFEPSTREYLYDHNLVNLPYYGVGKNVD